MSMIVLVGMLALLTVREHVERTQLGYDVRALEEQRLRLLEEVKTARLEYEQTAVTERIIERAVALQVAGRAELEALSRHAR